MQYKKMLIAVGALIFATMVLLVFSVGYIVQKKGIFEKKYHYKLVAKSGADLVEGMPILYSGFEIGTVTKMKLTESGDVEIVIEIPESQIRWIKSDSKFILDKPLIGSPKIVVQSPNLDAQTLSMTEVRDIVTQDGINELVAKVQPVLDNLQGILQNVNTLTSKEGDLTKILHHVEVTTGKIAQSRAVQRVDEVMDEVKQISVMLKEDIDKAMKQVDKMFLADHNSSAAKVNAMLDDINQKVKSLNATVEAINGVSKELGGLTKDVKFSMKKADSVLEGVNGIIGSEPEGEVTLP